MDAKEITRGAQSSGVLEDARLLHRPDGYYIVTDDGELGPFPNAAEALEATATDNEDTLAESETLAEAEAELGVSGWVDPDSGELAEESIPRLEEH